MKPRRMAIGKDCYNVHIKYLKIDLKVFNSFEHT